MTAWNNPWLLVVLAPGLLVLGAMIYRIWVSRKVQARRRIPKHWPLKVRSITNSEEARVWHWLARAFNDHHVMIKLPVTRFTLPLEREEGMDWYRLLGGVYCTFTICNADGRIVGCIDVPGKKCTAAQHPPAQAFTAHPVRHTLLGRAFQKSAHSH